MHKIPLFIALIRIKDYVIAAGCEKRQRQLQIWRALNSRTEYNRRRSSGLRSSNPEAAQPKPATNFPSRRYIDVLWFDNIKGISAWNEAQT
jgi:hypothetical protein